MIAEPELYPSHQKSSASVIAAFFSWLVEPQAVLDLSEPCVSSGSMLKPSIGAALPEVTEGDAVL